MFQPPAPKQPSEDAIIVQNLSKHFRIPHEKKTTLFEHIKGAITGGSSQYEEFWALKDVSFSVKKGETLGIIGENGSGKSTLLKIIAGVLSPDSGSAKVNGRIAPFLELGVGFQGDLTAEDNVRLYGAIMGMTKQEMENKFEEIFEFAELSRFRNMKLKNFSSGMYARLAFATAVATEPDMLLIDEVLAVGDEAFQEKSFNKMKEFKKMGKTILLVSHDYKIIQNFCENAILINDGEIAGNGTSTLVIDQYHAIISTNQKDLSSLVKNGKDSHGLRRYGTFDAEIVKIELYNELGEKTTNIKTGEKTVILLEILFNKDVFNPIIGMLITRKDGFYVYGNNTNAMDMKFDTLRKGEKLFVKFSQYMRLNDGIYHISPAVAYTEGTRFCDWQNEALTFSVKKDKMSFGLVDLMSDIEIFNNNKKLI